MKTENYLNIGIRMLVIFMLIFVILVLGYIAFIIIGNYDTFSKNPLILGMKQYRLDNCSCITERNTEFSFNKSTILNNINKGYKAFEINTSIIGEFLGNYTIKNVTK